MFLFMQGVSTFFLVYGENDFAAYPFQGPYEVGFKVIRTHIKFDNEVYVYYPMDRDKFK